MTTQYLTHITPGGKVRPCNARTRACKFAPGTPAQPTRERFKTFKEYEKAKETDRSLDYRSDAFFWDDDFKIEMLAHIFHQRAASVRGLDGKGRYVENWKETTDTYWRIKHGKDKVDLANTPYHELPDDWKKENYEAAVFVVKEFVDTEHIIHTSDDEARNEVGERIHQAWLQRNPAAKGGPLDVPFKDLPADEQEKDISQYRFCLISFFGRMM